MADNDFLSIAQNTPIEHHLFQLIQAYLQDGLSLDDVTKQLHALAQQEQKTVYHLLTSVHLDKDSNKEILTILEIRNHAIFESDRNLFQLLDHINHDGYGYSQLDFLIQNVLFYHYVYLSIKAIATLVCIPLMGLFILNSINKELFQQMMNSCIHYCAELLKKGFESIGLIRFASINQFSCNLILLILLLKDTFQYGFDDWERKVGKVLLPAASALLNITGSLLSEINRFSTIVVGCFLLASFLEMGHAFLSYYLIDNHTSHTTSPASSRRQQAQKDEAREILKIKVVSSLATIAAGVTLLFLPQLFVPYCIFVAIVFISKTLSLRSIKYHHTNKLQEELRTLNASPT